MKDSIERKRLTILKILLESQKPVGSLVIKKRLMDMGHNIPDRTVRFHLLYLDKMGFTEYLRKKGRRITEKGISELSRARVIEKVGFLAGKIDRLTYGMSYDIAGKKGTVVINLSIIEKKDIKKALELISKVFNADLAMGKLIALFEEGERIDENVIPDGHVGIGTVCSVTINGILLAQGIPTRSRFGGVLELQNHEPTRFCEIITYDGTTVDPLEIFIKSKMLDLSGAVTGGDGVIGASFREMPEESRDKVADIALQLNDLGLNGFLKIGFPGQTLCEIPVNAGAFGSIIKAGLNPVAILEESGIEVHSMALAGFADIERFTFYKKNSQ